jgi:hypothetical protein
MTSPLKLMPYTAKCRAAVPAIGQAAHSILEYVCMHEYVRTCINIQRAHVGAAGMHVYARVLVHTSPIKQEARQQELCAQSRSFKEFVA